MAKSTGPAGLVPQRRKEPAGPGAYSSTHSYGVYASTLVLFPNSPNPEITQSLLPALTPVA